jgi:hypothetical protein
MESGERSTTVVLVYERAQDGEPYLDESLGWISQECQIDIRLCCASAAAAANTVL